MEVGEKTSLDSAQNCLSDQKLKIRLKRIFVTPEFEDPKKFQILTNQIPGYELYLEKTRQVENQGRNAASSHLAACYAKPLLNKDQEYHLFRRYNYHKFLALKWIQLHRPSKAWAEIGRADAVRQTLTSANVRLAIPFVKKMKSARHHEDLVSESYYLIHRAVDYFDYTLGNKFSTYATWSIRNTMCRTAKELFEFDSMHSGELDNVAGTLAKNDVDQHEDNNQDHYKSIIEKLFACLNPREAEILRMRYFGDQTLKSVGEKLKITKERVRQLESKAFAKLKQKAQDLGLKIENIW